MEAAEREECRDKQSLLYADCHSDKECEVEVDREADVGHGVKKAGHGDAQEQLQECEIKTDEGVDISLLTSCIRPI